MQSPIAWLPVAASVLGVVSTLGGFFLYYNSTIRKKYAAERDFQHLKKNQEQMAQMLLQIDDSMNDMRTELARIAAKL